MPDDQRAVGARLRRAIGQQSCAPHRFFGYGAQAIEPAGAGFGEAATRRTARTNPRPGSYGMGGFEWFVNVGLRFANPTCDNR